MTMAHVNGRSRDHESSAPDERRRMHHVLTWDARRQRSVQPRVRPMTEDELIQVVKTLATDAPEAPR